MTLKEKHGAEVVDAITNALLVVAIGCAERSGDDVAR